MVDSQSSQSLPLKNKTNSMIIVDDLDGLLKIFFTSIHLVLTYVIVKSIVY